MNRMIASLAAAAAALLAIAANAAANGQDGSYKPMFVVPSAHNVSGRPTSRAGYLPTWTADFTYKATKYGDVMVGADPARSNRTTTIRVFIVPIKLVYGASNGNMTFDPMAHKLANGNTIVQDLIASPIFSSGVDFVQGGTDLGATQYIDAFQRGNFWSSVEKNPNYHVLLGSPKILSEQTVKVKASEGKVTSAFGATVGTIDINVFEVLLLGYMKKFAQINPGVLPLFVTYDAYLTSDGSCCIGGYHAVDRAQTYAYSTYVDTPGAFAQDVSGFSHVLGEWTDDPYATNETPCGGLDVAGPTGNEPDYGDFPYVLNGSTYNLQDLVFMSYFGAPRARSVNRWFSFQDDTSLGVCSDGP